MAIVTSFPKNPNRPIEQRLFARKMVAATVRVTALNEAYLHVLDYHPEVQTLPDKLELAENIAKSALFAAAKSLMDFQGYRAVDLQDES